MDYKRLGARIREERTKAHLTQERLAETVGVSTVFLGQIERSERKLSLSTLISIANALGVSIESLLKDSLEYDSDVLDHEISALLKGRTREEKELLLDVAKSIFGRLKDNTLQ